MKKALVLGKFLPPHAGHQYLIDFAIQYPEVDQVIVLVSTMDRESIPGIIRYKVLKDHYRDNMKVKVSHLHKALPQYPEENENFWAIWKHEISLATESNFDYVFASEEYGEPLAQLFNAKFIPVSIDRNIVPISGTAIRKNPYDNFNFLFPEFQKMLRKTVTFFGVESSGKSSAALEMTTQFKNSHFIPEYARGYLNNKGEEVTLNKMQDIAKGQFSSERSTLHQIPKPFIFRDTDILTTIGYWRLYFDMEPQWVRDLYLQSKSDLYIVMNENIKFTPDKLRYGIDKRESRTNYWFNLLEEFSCEYIEVHNTEQDKQIREIYRHIEEMKFNMLTSI